MTSFKEKQILDSKFMLTFKKQGQIYHTAGSLYPVDSSEPKFLQIYFVGDDNSEVELMHKNILNLDPIIVIELQKMLHLHNNLIINFKAAIDSQEYENIENLNIVIHTERVTNGNHPGCFNAPSVNEVGIVIDGQQFEKRDIILNGRNNTLKRINKLHRSYDALQYLLMFCRGEDGYNIAIPKFNPMKNQADKKKISASNFYSYKIMIRKNNSNY
jgi:hypothetical protein